MPILPATILFVDDDKLIIRAEQELLALAGYEVLVAYSALEALEILEQIHARIDIVFTDLNMPGENGYWLADKVSQLYPDIAVILSTGYANFLSNDIARQAKYPIILKPYTLRMTIDFFDAALKDRVLPPEKPEGG